MRKSFLEKVGIISLFIFTFVALYTFGLNVVAKDLPRDTQNERPTFQLSFHILSSESISYQPALQRIKRDKILFISSLDGKKFNKKECKNTIFPFLFPEKDFVCNLLESDALAFCFPTELFHISFHSYSRAPPFTL